MNPKDFLSKYVYCLLLKCVVHRLRWQGPLILLPDHDHAVGKDGGDDGGGEEGVGQHGDGDPPDGVEGGEEEETLGRGESSDVARLG